MYNDDRKYLTHYHGLSSASWNSEIITDALLADKYYSTDKEACKRACINVINALRFTNCAKSNGSDLVLDYVGNTELLHRSDKVSLICHHDDEQYFADQMGAIYDVAQRGSVVVSAFVNPKEKEIKRFLVNERLPFIEVLSLGITDGYHPCGRDYEMCLDGKLVQISPWDSRFLGEPRLRRDRCIVMNELVRVISKIPDEWWHVFM